MKGTYHFVAICGSLRKASYNQMTLNQLKKLTPPNVAIEQLYFADIPYYNHDLYGEKLPDNVEKLAEAIKDSDGLIIVSPEYNYSIPGALKNAIDFISRSPKRVFSMKAIGIMGASTGLVGTARMQYHLRQVMVFVNGYVMNKPEVMIAQAHTKFDAEGNLMDETTVALLKTFIDSFVKFNERFPLTAYEQNLPRSI